MQVKCHITASLDPATAAMRARAILRFTRETPGEELTLQLSPNLQVACIQSQGVTCDLFQPQAGRFVVTLPSRMSTAEQILEVDYAGHLKQYESPGEPARAFINEDFFWLRDDQRWFPSPVGWHAEEMLPVPPGRYVVQIQMPLGWEAAASAPLVRHWNDGTFEYYQWDTLNDYSGMSIVGGKLQKYIDGRCTFLWLAPRPDMAEIALGALDFCEALLGPCPHACLTIVMGPSFVPGGYADRGMVHVGENKLDTRTLTHELVHQWWGRGVWAKRHGDRWLTEGLAGYLSLLYLESRRETSLEETLEQYRAAYQQAVGTWGDKPLAQVNREDYKKNGLISALLYKKGAWLHRTLHSLLGDRYFQALQIVYSKYYGKFITTDQFIAELAGLCKEHRKAIQVFARQWLDAPGLPALLNEVVEKSASSAQEQVIP